jgi:N-acetylglutamate synthase-like GNAT family acetyltransferase
MIRPATAGDAPGLAALLTDYLQESYAGHRGSTPDELRRDVLAGTGSHRVVVAANEDQLVGFIAWDPIYDMHWAQRGGQVADLYVVPSQRGSGLVLELLTAACADVRAIGGTFLRGGAYDRATTRHLYARIAVILPSGECHCAGRAFRRLADLHGRPRREAILALPPPAWSFDP